MARRTSPIPTGEQSVVAIDLNQSGSEFSSRRFTPSMVAKGEFPPDDPIPLFLSSSAAQPNPPGFKKGWHWAVVSSPILKAGIMAVIAAATGFAALTVENPLALFASAKASLPGAAAAQSSTAPPRSVPEPVTAERLPGARPSAPTRDEIAAALRAAHQNQTEIRPPPAAAPPARRIDADELAALLKRAKGLIAIGDIAPARLLLERAADAQEAGAALLLAQTYDPVVLGTPDARSITPDPATARGWYQKAAQLGSKDAQRRLAQMQN